MFGRTGFDRTGFDGAGFDRAVAGLLAMLRAIRARQRPGGHYADRDERALDTLETRLADTAPGFVAQMMRGSLSDCPVLRRPEARQGATAA